MAIELNKLTFNEVVELFENGDVSKEDVTAIAEKFKDNDLVMIHCLNNGYDPSKVTGEVLRNKSVLFLKYRESIKTLSNLPPSNDKIALLEKLKSDCFKLLDEYFLGDDKLKQSFDELFSVGKENIEFNMIKDNYYRYQEFFYKRSHWIKENYSKSEEQEDRKLINFNDELVSNIENSYIEYTREKQFVSEILVSYDKVIKEGTNLESVINNTCGESLKFDSIELIKEKSIKIREYFGLCSIRENDKLNDLEEKEIKNLVSSNIKEIISIENKYQQFINYSNKMNDILKNAHYDKEQKDINELVVPNDSKDSTFKGNIDERLSKAKEEDMVSALQPKDPKYDIYLSYLQKEKHPALDRALEMSKRILNGQ